MKFDEEGEIYSRTWFIFDVVLSGILSGFGIAGNLMSLIVLCKVKDRSSTVYLLTTLAVVDTLFLVYIVVSRVIPGACLVSGYPDCNTVLSEGLWISWPLGCMAQTAGTWLIVAITCDRYLAVRFPFKKMIWSSSNQIKKVIIGILITAILFNIPRFFDVSNLLEYDNEIMEYDNGTMEYDVMMEYDNAMTEYDNEMKEYDNEMMEYDNEMTEYNNEMMEYDNEMMAYENEMTEYNEMMEYDKDSDKKKVFVSKERIKIRSFPIFNDLNVTDKNISKGKSDAVTGDVDDSYVDDLDKDGGLVRKMSEENTEIVNIHKILAQMEQDYLDLYKVTMSRPIKIKKPKKKKQKQRERKKLRNNNNQEHDPIKTIALPMSIVEVKQKQKKRKKQRNRNKQKQKPKQRERKKPRNDFHQNYSQIKTTELPMPNAVVTRRIFIPVFTQPPSTPRGPKPEAPIHRPELPETRTFRTDDTAFPNQTTDLAKPGLPIHHPLDQVSIPPDEEENLHFKLNNPSMIVQKSLKLDDIVNSLRNDTENDTEELPLGMSNVHSSKSILMQYIDYVTLTWLFVYLIPLTALFILNILLIFELRKAQRRHAQMTVQEEDKDNLAVTLNIIVMVGVFLVCQTPDFVHIVIAWKDIGLSLKVIWEAFYVSITFLTLNASVNFLIYCLFYRRFRKVFVEMIYGCQRNNQGSSTNSSKGKEGTASTSV